MPYTYESSARVSLPIRDLEDLAVGLEILRRHMATADFTADDRFLDAKVRQEAQRLYKNLSRLQVRFQKVVNKFTGDGELQPADYEVET